jgi:ABC-2 type transport system ATP-binding protein
MSEQDVVIRAKGVTRRFGRLLAVDGIDLEVRRGEVFGFLGPNGAGKSTLIRMLTGLLSTTSGSVEVLGCHLPQDAEALKPHVGYMTQRFSLYEDLSVLENLQFAAEIFGMDRQARDSRVEELLTEHGLDARRRQRAGSLSGGWKQRLALAAATIHHPRLLILDEPTAGVDPERRRAFWEKLFELASTGTTVLVSTHYMDEAVRCHRLAMIREGRMAAIGSPAELSASIQERVLELEATPQEKAIAVLNRLDQVASVTQMGHQVHVLLKANGPTAGQAAPLMIETLVQAGINNPRVLSTEPTLEDVFVALSLPEEGKVK